MRIKISESQKVAPSEVPEHLLAGLSLDIVDAINSGEMHVYCVHFCGGKCPSREENKESRMSRHERRMNAKLTRQKTKPGVDRNRRIRDKVLNNG